MATEITVQSDQHFLLIYITGLYFGPDLRTAQPKRPALQLKYQNLPNYTHDQLTGNHIKYCTIERVYKYVLRNADPDVRVTHKQFKSFMDGTLFDGQAAPNEYRHFTDLFPLEMHPHGRVGDRYLSIDNVIFIENPDISFLDQQDIERFKRLTTLDNIELDRDEASKRRLLRDEIPTPVTDPTLTRAGHRALAPAVAPFHPSAVALVQASAAAMLRTSAAAPALFPASFYGARAPIHVIARAPVHIPAPVHDHSRAPIHVPARAPVHIPALIHAHSRAPIHVPARAPVHIPGPVHAHSRGPLYAATQAPARIPTHAYARTSANTPTLVPTHAVTNDRAPIAATTQARTPTLACDPTPAVTQACAYNPAPTHACTHTPAPTPAPTPVHIPAPASVHAPAHALASVLAPTNATTLALADTTTSSPRSLKRNEPEQPLGSKQEEQNNNNNNNKKSRYNNDIDPITVESYGATVDAHPESVFGVVELAQSLDSYMFIVTLPGVQKNSGFSCKVDEGGNVRITGNKDPRGNVIERKEGADDFEVNGKNQLSPRGDFGISFKLPGPIAKPTESKFKLRNGILEGIVFKQNPVIT